MKKKNEQINMTGAELMEVLKEIEIIMISLRKIGSYYSAKYYDGELDKENGEYEKETTRFIDEWKVTHRLAKIRGVLTKKFDSTLGEDDMDDLERAMEELKFWEKPGDNPSDF